MPWEGEEAAQEGLIHHSQSASRLRHVSCQASTAVHSEQTHGLVANDESNFNRSIAQPDRLREMDAQIAIAQNWLPSEGWWWRGRGKWGLGEKSERGGDSKRESILGREPGVQYWSISWPEYECLMDVVEPGGRKPSALHQWTAEKWDARGSCPVRGRGERRSTRCLAACQAHARQRSHTLTHTLYISVNSLWSPAAFPDTHTIQQDLKAYMQSGISISALTDDDSVLCYAVLCADVKW